jgi:hypothetical protein
MQTQRLLNNTWFIFLGSLLGSVFGLMGTFATALGITEMISDFFKKREREKINLEKITDNTKKLHDEFGQWKVRICYNKVAPFGEITNSTINMTEV